MIPFAIPAALKAIPWRVLTFMGGVIVVLVLIAALIRMDGKLKRANAQIEQAQQTIAIMRQEREALEQAAVERVADTERTAAMEKDLNDAVKDAPVAPVSDRRRLLACARLRAQGTDTSRVAACQ